MDVHARPGQAGACAQDTARVCSPPTWRDESHPHPQPRRAVHTAAGAGPACGPDGVGRAARTSEEGATRGSLAGLLGRRSPGNPGLASPEGRRRQAAGGAA